MWKSIASNALTLFVVILIVLGGLIGWGKNQYVAEGPLEQAICLRVDRGSSMRKVSEDLAEKGGVANATVFRLGADYEDRSQNLKFGSYLIPAGSTMQEIAAIVAGNGRSSCGREVNFRIGVTTAEVIVRELDPATNEYQELLRYKPAEEDAPEKYSEIASGDDVIFRVTMAEGVTSWQAVESLKSVDFMEGEVEAVPPEGALAPDSYDVERGGNRVTLLTLMQEKQSAALAELWGARAADLPYASPEEALIMASIVEKETGLPEERAQVASVFVNRLNQGMKLQTDPTVIYGVTKGRGTLGRGLRQSELRGETPYNTYVIDGLPPTPIANPGRNAIKAALNPDSTPYLFFVADGTGGHAFAETLQQHNENVARWREIEAERARQQD